MYYQKHVSESESGKITVLMYVWEFSDSTTYVWCRGWGVGRFFLLCASFESKSFFIKLPRHFTTFFCPPAQQTKFLLFFSWTKVVCVCKCVAGLFAASAVFYSSLLLLLMLALVQIICWRTGERVEGHCTHLLFYFLFISFQFCVYFSLFRFVFILIFFFDVCSWFGRFLCVGRF